MTFSASTDWNSSSWASNCDLDWDEAWEYQPGFTVELNAQPGVSYQIDSYDPTMVPPVWLVGQPRPRYPHELRVVSRSTHHACHLPAQAAPAQRSPLRSLSRR